MLPVKRGIILLNDRSGLAPIRLEYETCNTVYTLIMIYEIHNLFFKMKKKTQLQFIAKDG